MARASAPYVAGIVTADTSGVVTFAVLLDRTAREGSYAVTATSGDVRSDVQVTMRAGAPLLSPPAGVPVMRGQPALFLPLLRR